MMFLFLLAHAVAAEPVGDPDAGAALFEANCVRCHGEDGRLGVKGAAQLPDVVPKLDDATIRATVLHGRKEMPAFDFDETQLADLLAWLRTAFPRQ
jgi:mono/diheme cytochrome c family protein